MAVVIDATVGGANANSYLTLAEAETFFEASLNVTSWTAASDDVKNAALVEATREIDIYFEWIGIIYTVDQALSWPRNITDYRGDEFGYDEVGYGYQLDKNPADGTIPQILKNAVCKLAKVLIDGGYSIEEQNIDEIKVGPIDIKFSKTIKESGFPKEVIDMLLRIGHFIVTGNNALHQYNLQRA